MSSIFEALGGHIEYDIDGEAVLREELSPAQIRDIRARYRSGAIRQVDLADEYGVSQPYISRIVNHKRRKGVE